MTETQLTTAERIERASAILGTAEHAQEQGGIAYLSPLGTADAFKLYALIRWAETDPDMPPAVVSALPRLREWIGVQYEASGLPVDDMLDALHDLGKPAAVVDDGQEVSDGQAAATPAVPEQAAG